MAPKTDRNTCGTQIKKALRMRFSLIANSSASRDDEPKGSSK